MIDRTRKAPLGALALFSMLVMLFSSGAQARRSKVNGQHLEQGSTFEEFTVYEEPFSKTDAYINFNAFVIGAKLADTYEYTDECLYDMVQGIDNIAYFNNNVTDHQKLLESGEKDSNFEVFLNLTGIFYGPVADSLPNCYLFAYSVYSVESDRFLTFNSNWGNFFLAFLFNQMGNALNFQTKFERIQTEQERQNYAGVWQEYGDLAYLVWNFSPIEEGSLENVGSMVQRWMDEHEWLNEVIPESQKPFVQATATGLASYVHQAGTAFGTSLMAAKNVFGSPVEKMNRDIAEKQQEQIIVTDQVAAERVSPKVSTHGNIPQDIAYVIDGIFTGVVDVFPYDSNPQRCQGNSTQSWAAAVRFYTRINDAIQQTGSFSWSSSDDLQDLIDDVSFMLKAPFGISYSCYWGFSTVVVDWDPQADGEYTVDEQLEDYIRLSSDVLTNIYFNLGYIYNAVYHAYFLVDTYLGLTDKSTADDDFLYQVAIYVGDILIRFFWRDRFVRNFEY